MLNVLNLKKKKKRAIGLVAQLQNVALHGAGLLEYCYIELGGAFLL